MAFLFKILQFFHAVSFGVTRRVCISIGALTLLIGLLFASLQLHSVQQKLFHHVVEKHLPHLSGKISISTIDGFFPIYGKIGDIQVQTPEATLAVQNFKWHFSLTRLAFSYICADTISIKSQKNDEPLSLPGVDVLAGIINQRLLKAIHIKDIRIDGPFPWQGSLQLEPHENQGQKLKIESLKDSMECHIFHHNQAVNVNFDALTPVDGFLNSYMEKYIPTIPKGLVRIQGSLSGNLWKNHPEIQGIVIIDHEIVGAVTLKGMEKDQITHLEISTAPKRTVPVYITTEINHSQKNDSILTVNQFVVKNNMGGTLLAGQGKINFKKEWVFDGVFQTIEDQQVALNTHLSFDPTHQNISGRFQNLEDRIEVEAQILGDDIHLKKLAGIAHNLTFFLAEPTTINWVKKTLNPTKINFGKMRLDVGGTLDHSVLKATLNVFYEKNHLIAVQGNIENVFEDATLNFKATNQINLEILAPFLGGSDRIQGILNTNLAIQGSIKKPQLVGTIYVDSGLYENAFAGTFLNHVNLKLRAQGQQFVVETLTFEDGQKKPGSAVGEGTVHFENWIPYFDIQIHLNRFEIANNDGIEGHATGFLHLKGLGTEAKILGEATLDKLILSIEELAPVEIPVLVSVDAPPAPEKKPPLPYFLMDVTLKASEIYIIGFGIESVWHGEMQVINPVSSPDLLGTITLKKGKLEILGKPMKLRKGTITYDLEKLSDPLLKIRATKEQGGEKIALKIEGRASNPKFTFTSSPPLPEEEVLSRLLFGKEISAISPTQSLQLATAAASMNGQGGLNVMDTFRKSFRFDSFELKDNKRFNTTSGEEETSRSLSLGKEFGPMKLSLDQGVSTGANSKATAEIELSRNLSLEGDVGGDRNSGIGLTWRKRY